MGMFDQMKTRVGEMLRPLRAGPDKLAHSETAAPGEASIELSSPAFANGGGIPIRYTADGDNVSPPMRWSGVPGATQELVLICEDPDAPLPSPFVHWVVHNIAPDATELPGGITRTAQPEGIGGLRQGRNTMRQFGYAGPAPPKGHGPHRYFFQLFALDVHIEAGEKPTRDDLVRAMRGHVIARGEVMGTYER